MTLLLLLLPLVPSVSGREFKSVKPIKIVKPEQLHVTIPEARSEGYFLNYVWTRRFWLTVTVTAGQDIPFGKYEVKIVFPEKTIKILATV